MSGPTYPPVSPELVRKRRDLAPDIQKAFEAFSASVFADGALPVKTKQLIAVAVAHVTQCPYCIGSHTKAALRLGATEQELMEAIWVAAEMRAVDLGFASFTADAQRLDAGCHGLAQFVRQHEGRFILHVEIPAEGEHALALHLVAEDRDGHQVGLQRQLVPSKQGARRRRKIGPARLAAPARLVFRAAAVIASLAAATGTNRLAIGLRPTQAGEHILSTTLGHPHDLAQAERTGSRGQEEVLRHQGRLDR